MNSPEKDKVKDFSYPKFLQAVEGDHIVKDSIIFNVTAKEIKGQLNEEGRQIYGGTDFSYRRECG